MLVFVFMIFLGGKFAASAEACAPVKLPGYTPTKESSGEFFSAATGLTLTVKCLPDHVVYEQASEKYKKEANMRNTNTDAVYFEFLTHGRYKRIYLIAGSPVLELTFSARRKHRAALDDTQYIIEKQFKRPKFRRPR